MSIRAGHGAVIVETTELRRSSASRPKLGRMAAIAKVEPLLTTRALSGPFDYRLPEGMDVDTGSILVVPFGRQKLLGVVVGVADKSAVPQNKLLEPLKALEAGVPAELVELGLAVAREYASTPARGLQLVLPPGIKPGKAGTSRVKERFQIVAHLADDGISALEENGTRLSDKQRQILEALRNEDVSVANLHSKVNADHGSVRRLEKRGLVELDKRPVRRRPSQLKVGAITKIDRITEDQQRALERITKLLDERGVDDGSGSALLLQGVTGSGKTEVYLRAAEESLARKRPVIVLVPEIALTPQTVFRFQERFGDCVAVLHSKLGQGERFDEWQRLLRGEATICVGPRSAIYAPVVNPGLIVIDEEHDASYKQENDPRYDARRVAEMRADRSGAVLVFGSATPRPESRQRLTTLKLPKRVDGQSLPNVDVLDMRESKAILHPKTRRALSEVRERKEKAILLLNRRGWSSFLICRSCGEVRQCRNCEVSLTLHRSSDGDRLICHHCGYSEQVGSKCPTCNSASVARFGVGTAKLETELATVLDPLPIFRLDADTTVAKESVGRVLQQFDSAETGILLGTQMVAKGHDFPDVTLAVVLDADASLRFPDFRSEERTFALISQLAGRSGRGPAGGRVLVQTMAPGAECIKYAAGHDTDGFLDAELVKRKEIGYPPFVELARVVVRSEIDENARETAQTLVEKLQNDRVTVLGPSPLFRLKGLYRWQVLIKGANRNVVVDTVSRAVSGLTKNRRKRKVSLTVDIDPQ